VINNDGGGNVYDYATQWRMLRDDYIIVKGSCYSSCTMVLGNYPNVCVMPDAELGFHRSYYWTIFGYITSYKGTEFMWSYYPEDIKELVTKNGGLLADRGGWWTPGILRLKGSDLPEKYHCKPS
jgi:hypothetical protein